MVDLQPDMQALALASMDDIWCEIARRFASPGAAALVYRHETATSHEFVCRVIGPKPDIVDAVKSLRICAKQHKDKL